MKWGHCFRSFFENEKKCIPSNAVSGCQHISVVDQRASAIQHSLVEYRHHPRKDVWYRYESTDNAIRDLCRYSALCYEKKIEYALIKSRTRASV